MKKTLPMRLLAMVFCVAMLVTVTPVFASAESATYLDYNVTTGKTDVERTATGVNVIDEATDEFVTGWNIVQGDVEIEERVTLPKNVNLILANDATLTAKKGITVAADGDFAVYAQSNDEDTMGKLIVPESVDEFMAGIGCTERGTCGNITIYGGAVTAQGGFDGAGIGGGYESTCGNISIHGGSITATGNQLGAGIGNGYSGECGNITIYGGTVTAESASHGAGIGSGSYGSCGEVTLAGGIVTAHGGKYGAGIGGGFGASCTKVTVSGGYIKATAGTSADSIGTGYSSGVVVPVSIDDSCVSVTKDGSQYINYEPVAAVSATCMTTGCAAYFEDCVSGNYYTAFPFTEDGLIGDATALAAWKAEGGDGYVEKLPHADNNEDDRCDSCGAVHAIYLDYNETTGQVDTECEVWGVNVIENGGFAFKPSWNIVYGNVTFDERIALPSNVKLILANGATLTAKKGISVPEHGAFAIYAQSNDAATMGKLDVLGSEDGLPSLGSSGPNQTDDITIYGGMVTVQGEYGCAAIGTVSDAGDSCDITIRGGVVTARGSNNSAGIGSGQGASCGNITISGGIVTAQGGYGGGAGIGSGQGASCGNITISGGVVTAQSGYEGGAGIGSGSGASCGNITISGGYVKATASSNTNPISAGYGTFCGTVSIASSCTSVIVDKTQYINYMILAREPNCTEAGWKAYYFDPANGYYYTAISLAADKFIGDAEALAAWKAQGGGGYVAPLGHDWEFVDEDTHKCTRCETTAAHTNVDYYCADCGHVLLELAKAVAEAKGAAKAALDAAANPVGSDAQAQVLSDAKAAVDAAKTLDGVATAKENGLSAIAAQKATELAAKIDELKADITDNLFPAAKCDDAKDILYAALDELDAAATESEANDIYNTAKDEANGKDAEFTDKLTNYKATFSLAITDAASEETKKFVEDVQTALDNAPTIAVLDGIYAETEPYISFHATKDNILSQCNEILENFDGTEAMKAIFEMTVATLSETANMDELEEAYAYCAEQIEMQRERESFLPKYEMILASDEYSDDVKALVRELMEALNAAKSLDEIEYVFYEYVPAINLQAARDEWMEKLEELLPEEPSDAVTAIIQDARKLILYGEDSSIFDNVYDIARLAIERQLIAETNTKALEDLLNETEEALVAANDTIDELNNTITSKEATIAEQQAALDTATEQLNAAKADLEKAKAQIAALETTTTAQAEALAQAEQQMKALQAEIERLKALLDDDPTEPQPTDPTEPQPTDPTEPTEKLLGDANDDGAVNMKDVLTLRKMLADMEVAYNAQNSDVNGDDDVNMKDVLMLRKYLAGLIETLGA